ncbi:MAG TPA: hypothetical protein VGL60_00815 [Acidimicrobiales bacterium]
MRHRVSVLHADHHHPHDPSDVVEWIITWLAVAFAVTLVCALAFQIGRP